MFHCKGFTLNPRSTNSSEEENEEEYHFNKKTDEIPPELGTDMVATLLA